MVKNTKINIFEIADANADRLEKEYQRIQDNCDKNKSVLLEKFRDKIREEWHLSINIKDMALTVFLDSGDYKNVYALKEEQAAQLIDMGVLEISGKKPSTKKAIKKHLKSFFESRAVFDSSIMDGEKSKYTALNVGGTGANRYGPYCVIIKRETAENYNTLAFIKEDSAIHYVDGKSLVIDKLAKEVSNKECMDLLAALKHEAGIETVSAHGWPGMVCSNTDYIESVTLDDILSSHIKSVRVDKTYYDSIYKDSLLKLFYSELAVEEHYRLAAFQRLLTQLEEHGIELEIIDEN